MKVLTTAGLTQLIAKIKAHVSGSNDGTNWTQLTIGGVTKGISSGTSYTGGAGVSVSGNTIAVNNDTTSPITFTAQNKLTLSTGHGIDVDSGVLTADIDTLKGLRFDPDANAIQINADGTLITFTAQGALTANIQEYTAAEIDTLWGA